MNITINSKTMCNINRTFNVGVFSAVALLSRL